MTQKYETLPDLEDLVGAGFDLSLAMSFQAYMRDERWEPFRAWTFLLKRATESFQKLSQEDLAKHVRDHVGNVTLAEVGR